MKLSSFHILNLHLLIPKSCTYAYIDIPRPSSVKFQPPGLFWWLRGTNFTPLEDSGKYTHIYIYMGVSKNSGTPKSSILTGFSIINHPFWGTPIFGNTHLYLYIQYSHILHHYCCPRFPESQLSSGSAWSFTEQAALIPPPGLFFHSAPFRVCHLDH